MPVDPDHGSDLASPLSHWLMSLSMACLLLSTVGRLRHCGERWIGSSNYRSGQFLSAFSSKLGSSPTIPPKESHPAIILLPTHLDSSLHLQNVLLHFGHPMVWTGPPHSLFLTLFLPGSLDNNNSY